MNLSGWAEHEAHEANAAYDDHNERYAEEIRDAIREGEIAQEHDYLCWRQDRLDRPWIADEEHLVKLAFARQHVRDKKAWAKPVNCPF